MTDTRAETKLDWSDPDEWKALDMAEKLAAIKSAVTVAEVVELLGIEIENDKIASPWNPGERTPSCHIYDDHFYDYATGNHGDLFDLWQALNTAGTDQSLTLSEMAWQIRNKAVRAGREPGDVEPQRPRQVQDLSQMLPINVCHVVAGIDTRPFMTRIDGSGTVYVPHIQADHNPMVYGIKLRRTDGAKISVPGSTYSHRLYSPTGWTHLNKSRRCVITEGESDAWAMWHQLDQRGIDVFALPSGSATWKDHWLEDLELYSEVLLCMDNDRAGQAALEKITRKVGFDRARTLKVPALYNDAREAMQAGWEPQP